MIKLTSSKLEEMTKTYYNRNSVFIGLLCDDKCNISTPRKFAFWNKDNDKLLLIPEKNYVNILKAEV